MYLCRFLCALQPHDRKKWAQRYAQLIKPGGQLATLIFPVDPNKDRNEGPPFPVTPELYTELLEPLGTLSTHDCDASPSSGAIESGVCFHAAFSGRQETALLLNKICSAPVKHAQQDAGVS